MDKTSYDFLDVLRGTIEDKVSTLDQTIYCKIVGINEDYTLDVTVVPDEVTRIRSVVNASKYEFKVGDYGILYKIGNNLANAFIIAKLGPSSEDNQPLSKQVSGGGDEGGSGGTVVNNYYQTIQRPRPILICKTPLRLLGQSIIIWINIRVLLLLLVLATLRVAPKSIILTKIT